MSDFIAAVKSTSALQEKLKAAVDDDAISAIAIEAGLQCPIGQIKAALGADDIKSALTDNDELTAEQLEAVAGGAAFIGGIVAGTVAAAYTLSVCGGRGSREA